MPSFQITISPHRRAAARFIANVRRELQRAFSEEKAKRGLNQSEIGRILGVHRTVIHRELRGDANLTLSRVAELAYALGKVPKFSLDDVVISDGKNTPHAQMSNVKSSSTSGAASLPSSSGRFVSLAIKAA